MLKTTLTAAALILAATIGHAATGPAEQLLIETAPHFEELSFYCEWAYVYDQWGNWAYVYQCY